MRPLGECLDTSTWLEVDIESLARRSISESLKLAQLARELASAYLEVIE